MSRTRLEAQPRTEKGKGAARRTRRDGRIPAVIYGQGGQVEHISLPARETTLALRSPKAPLEIQTAGGLVLVVAREIQKDPVSREIEHLDLLRVTEADAAAREAQA